MILIAFPVGCICEPVGAESRGAWVAGVWRNALDCDVCVYERESERASKQASELVLICILMTMAHNTRQRHSFSSLVSNVCAGCELNSALITQ
jgi:hypothetical protein